jgi:5-methyltetrahydrofolate--homocysteine methyltransferase
MTVHPAPETASPSSEPSVPSIETTAAGSRLAELLSARGVLLADGATGTNLFDMGLMSGDAPELWNDTHPERIRALHQGFVDAGADIILTNSFGCNRRRLALHGLEPRTAELAAKAARLAREVADASGRVIVVAGSVGPTGDLFEPIGPMTEDEAVGVFAEAIAGLKAGGADVAWIETMSAAVEMRAAARAAEQVGLPYVLTASFDTAGRTMMGLTPAGLADLAAGFHAHPVAIGANCGVGASDLLVSVGQITATDPDLVVVAKANCGIPKVAGDKVVYTGTPELMADYARLAIDTGARIVGGCCGTTAGHLAAMRAAVDAHIKRARPTEAEIVATVGPLASPPPEAGEGRVRSGRRRG